MRSMLARGFAAAVLLVLLTGPPLGADEDVAKLLYKKAEKASRGQRWEEAVGQEIADHCIPISLRGGVLEARVESSVWSQQLQPRRPEILAGLRRVFGDEAPTDVRFRVG